MRKFQLYFRSGKQRILITDFDTLTKQNITPTSTFNEKISKSDNDQINFTFSLSATYLDGGKYVSNPWVARLHHHTILELVEDNQTYDLVISSIEPDTSTKKLIYNYTAKDYFSYILSRRCLGFTYCNIPDADLDYNTYPELYDNYGVESIFQIGSKILRKAYMYDWQVYFKEGDAEYEALAQKPISLDVSDTNPYNALVEACNSLNCCMRVDYANKMITFLEKSHIPFSGYRYRPEYNLRSLSVSYNGEELTTLMHVEGGKNEKDQYITITPYFPYAVNRWLALFYNKIEWYDKEHNKRIVGNGYGNWGVNNNIDFLLPTRLDDNGNTIIGWWDNIKNTIATYPESFLSYYAIAEKDRDPSKLQEEQQELNDFFTLIAKVPYAGQYILDMEFFELKGEFSAAKKAQFHSTLNGIARYNIMLKDIVYSRNNLRYEIESIMAKVMGQADIYTSILLTMIDQGVEKASQYESDLTEVGEKIKSYIGALGKKLFLLHGAKSLSDYPEIQTFDSQHKQAEAQRQYKEYETLYKEYNRLLKENSSSDYTVTDLEAKAANYENLYKTYFAWGAGANEPALDNHLGTYAYLYSMLTNPAYVAVPTQLEEGVNYSMPLDQAYTSYTASLDALTGDLYHNFGQYIVESKYTNSDEIDPISLYNQAITYFQDLYKPKAEYNIETINIRQLELISVPQLQVNSKIRIYNSEIGLDDAQNDTISERENELIVTSISYSLRDNLNVSVGVEQITRYNSILQKLIQSISNR